MTQTATTITVDSLPVANSIDPVQDRVLIYTASATDIQGISRNVYLGLSSQPVGINDSQTLTTKVLDNTNSLTIKAANLVIQDGTDTTKQAKFIASGITAGNTRSYTLPDYNATLATLAGTETLTNKTLTAPVTTAISNTGGLTTNAATVSGAATVGTTLAVTGATTLSSTLAVTGASTLTGAIGGAGYSMGTMANPYKFFAYQSSGQAIVTGSDQGPLNLQTKLFDTGTNFSTSTMLFTAPIAGFYFFSWSVTYPITNNSIVNTLLYVNGAVTNGIAGSVIANSTGGTQTKASVGAGLIQLSANDTVGLYANVGNNATINAFRSQTYLQGFLVSQT